jgi:hypothetical protein
MVKIIMARLNSTMAYLILILGSRICNRTFAGIINTIIPGSFNSRYFKTKWEQRSSVCSHFIRLIDSSESRIRKSAVIPLTFHAKVSAFPSRQAKGIVVCQKLCLTGTNYE